LTAPDCALVGALGIRTIADLRSDAERKHAPTPGQIAERVRMLAWSDDTQPAGHVRFNSAEWQGLPTDALRGQMAKLYVRLIDPLRSQMADIVRVLSDGGAPFLIHCTVGKDRTGLIIAVLLDLLGVPRDWILWDYEQTSRHLQRHKVNFAGVTAVGGPAEGFEELGSEALDIMLSADRTYLLSALADIETNFGSVEGFACTSLGLSAETLGVLRGRLLEAA
jgi:protein-tyrosine phosphatase